MGLVSAILSLDSKESVIESAAFLGFLALAAKSALDYYYAVYYYETLITGFVHTKA
jgi:hypothetical protein